MKPFTRIGIEVETYENLKKYMKNHASEIREHFHLNDDKAVTYSNAIDYIIAHNTTKQPL